MTDLSKAEWFKSTRSNGSSTCVEVATNIPGVVAVQDSTNPGPAMVISPDAWRNFLTTIKDWTSPQRPSSKIYSGLAEQSLVIGIWKLTNTGSGIARTE